MPNITNPTVPETDNQKEYLAKQIATGIRLRAYFNECVAIMAQEQGGTMLIGECMAEFDKLDALYAKDIVDDLSPLKHIIVSEI